MANPNKISKEMHKRMVSANEYLTRAQALRDEPAKHYNCAQAVFIPFAEEKGIPAEQAAAITANFGAGMHTGGTCGAITGGLMALGLCGLGGAKTTVEFFRRMKALHEGRTQCQELLAAEVHSKGEKKPHCDNMVCEAVGIVTEMLEESGK